MCSLKFGWIGNGKKKSLIEITTNLTVDRKLTFIVVVVLWLLDFSSLFCTWYCSKSLASCSKKESRDLGEKPSKNDNLED